MQYSKNYFYQFLSNCCKILLNLPVTGLSENHILLPGSLHLKKIFFMFYNAISKQNPYFKKIRNFIMEIFKNTEKERIV